MPIFKVTQDRTDTCVNFVEAETAEEAIANAARPEAGDWAIDRTTYGPVEAVDATDECMALLEKYRRRSAS